MPQEIERKFIVPKPPANLKSFKHYDILQGYFSVSNPGVDIRIRSIDKRYYITFKHGRGLVREETEIEISHAHFVSLWEIPDLKSISKTRFEIPMNSVVIELDVFKGKWEGLIIAEIEFISVEKSEVFDTPDWFGEEVTENPNYRNSSMARNFSS